MHQQQNPLPPGNQIHRYQGSPLRPVRWRAQTPRVHWRSMGSIHTSPMGLQVRKGGNGMYTFHIRVQTCTHLHLQGSPLSKARQQEFLSYICSFSSPISSYLTPTDFEVSDKEVNKHDNLQKITLHYCCGLNCVPSKIHMLKPSSPHVMIFGDGAFGR